MTLPSNIAVASEAPPVNASGTPTITSGTFPAAGMTPAQAPPFSGPGPPPTLLVMATSVPVTSSTLPAIRTTAAQALAPEGPGSPPPTSGSPTGVSPTHQEVLH